VETVETVETVGPVGAVSGFIVVVPLGWDPGIIL
jgi:hypothetical protein